MRHARRLTALMDRTEQRPEWCYTATMFSMCVWVCMCYLISPESTAHPMDPVGKGGVEGCLFVSLCACVRRRECRDIDGAIF